MKRSGNLQSGKHTNWPAFLGGKKDLDAPGGKVKTVAEVRQELARELAERKKVVESWNERS